MVNDKCTRKLAFWGTAVSWLNVPHLHRYAICMQTHTHTHTHAHPYHICIERGRRKKRRTVKTRLSLTYTPTHL